MRLRNVAARVFSCPVRVLAASAATGTACAYIFAPGNSRCDGERATAAAASLTAPPPRPTQSFWLSHGFSADEQAHACGTSAHLPAECEVVVIGAGASGASAAYHLREAGRNVRLFDRFLFCHS